MDINKKNNRLLESQYSLKITRLLKNDQPLKRSLMKTINHLRFCLLGFPQGTSEAIRYQNTFRTSFLQL